MTKLKTNIFLLTIMFFALFVTSVKSSAQDTGACIFLTQMWPRTSMCYDGPPVNEEDMCEIFGYSFYPAQKCCVPNVYGNSSTYFPDVQQGCCSNDTACISGVIDMGYYTHCLGYQCTAGNYECINGTCEAVTTTSTTQVTTSLTIQPTTTTTAPPTVIELSSFSASPRAGKIILNWSTESEIENAGFNIYRAEKKDGAYIKLNDSLVPAEGISTEGASYEFIDTNVQNRKIYYYKLEDIDISGTSTMHGPVSVTPRLLFRFFKQRVTTHEPQFTNHEVAWGCECNTEVDILVKKANEPLAKRQEE